VDLKSLEKVGRETADRREFLKKAGKVAATVPAVALLLSANATPAEAFGRYGRDHRGHRPKPGHHYRRPPRFNWKKKPHRGPGR